MSKFTDFLNLFMWDSVEDSEEEFNIDKALNDNWNKIDTKVKTHVNGINEEINILKEDTNTKIKTNIDSVNEKINSFKKETDQKIENIQALPVGRYKRTSFNKAKRN